MAKKTESQASQQETPKKANSTKKSPSKSKNTNNPMNVGDALSCFLKKNYDKVASTCDSSEKGAVMKKISELWEALTEEEKRAYEDMPDEEAASADKKKDKKSKKPKDPNAPKNPPNAFSLFVKDKREEAASTCDASEKGGVMKKLGEMWKTISEEEKKKYEEQAGEAKSKWEEEVKKYKENKVQDMEEEEGSEKEEEHNIKRPRTCFIIYNAAKREEVKESLGSEATTKDIVKKLSEMWNALSKEEKQEWQKKGEEDKERYNKEMKDAGLTVSNKRKRNENEPKRYRNSFFFFKAAKSAEIVGDNGEKIDQKERMKRISAMWKLLADEEKQIYEQMAADDKLRYEEEKNSMTAVIAKDE